jgi:enterochelin esterase-like enzyme
VCRLGATTAVAATPSAGPATIDAREALTEEVSSAPLAGGTLHVLRIGPLQLRGLEGGVRTDTRTVRVWLPAVDAAAVPNADLNVLVLHDGQNLFTEGAAFGGSCWRAAHAASAAISRGEVAPLAIIGIDHAGPLRSLDFLPCAPGVGVGGMRAEAAEWPGGGVEPYLDAVADVILPAVRRRFSLTADPARTALGGSSFGGIATLHALVSGHRLGKCFSAALVESPSLWIDEGRYLQTTLLPAADPRLTGITPRTGTPSKVTWPTRLYLAMGMREHSGSRPTSGAAGAVADSQYSCAAALLAAALGMAGMGSDRLFFLLEPGASHTERDWARRLPNALKFLMAPMPGRKLPAGTVLLPPPVLIPTLAAAAAAAAAAALVITTTEPALVKAPADAAAAEVAAPAAEAAPAGSADAALAAASVVAAPPAAAVAAVAAAAVAAPIAAAVAASAPPASPKAKAKATPSADTAAQRAAALQAATAAAAAAPNPAAARAAGGALFYFAPADLVAGAPATVYVNRSRSKTLCDAPGLRMIAGFDGWKVEGGEPLALTPASGLPSGPDDDWWTGRVEVPETAGEMNFVFSDTAGEAWDNAGGADYSMPVVPAEEVLAPAVPRRVASSDEQAHAGGTLHILTLAPREGGAKGSAEARAARWQEEKTLRVWTPPGWSLEHAPPGGYPVLYISDAQNLFDDAMAHQGVSWRAAEALAALITQGALPPMLLVGIDAAGAFRSLNFLPFPPGVGVGNFRPECARWPGGGVDAYVRRIVSEVMPLAEARFGASAQRTRRAFGGASFGGVAALHAALSYPHIFGSVLAESPSLWVGEGRYLDTLERHEGPLPERLFLGSGTREYSATRDHENVDVDALLLHYHSEAARILTEKGMGSARLKFVVDEGGGHHEGAWGWRLSGALMHLFNGRAQ